MCVSLFLGVEGGQALTPKKNEFAANSRGHPQGIELGNFHVEGRRLTRCANEICRNRSLPEPNCFLWFRVQGLGFQGLGLVSKE